MHKIVNDIAYTASGYNGVNSISKHNADKQFTPFLIMV